MTGDPQTMATTAGLSPKNCTSSGCGHCLEQVGAGWDVYVVFVIGASTPPFENHAVLDFAVIVQDGRTLVSAPEISKE